MKMDDPTAQQTAPQSNRDEELDKALVADLIEQPKQLDKLARILLIISFVMPVLYAIGLKLFSGAEASSSSIWLMVSAFLSWFVSLLLSLFALLSGKGNRDKAGKGRAAGNKGKPASAEALYLASARSKRRRLLASSLFCFTGICFAGLTIFSAAFPGLSSMPSSANFVLIHGSEFTMGSPETEVDRQIGETQHQVKVSDFYMGNMYNTNLSEVTRKIITKCSSAIFVSTTPFFSSIIESIATGNVFAMFRNWYLHGRGMDEVQLNTIARSVTDRFGVHFIDIAGQVREDLIRNRKPNDVHFPDPYYAVVAEPIAEEVEKVLEKCSIH